MTFDGAAVRALRDALMSHAQGLGIFERVAAHEPKNAPGPGLSCTFWLESIKPVQSSGLAAVSGQVTFQVRIYEPFLAEPQDDIDADLLAATSTLLDEYSGHFTLAGSVRDIDLMALSAVAGYLEQDRKIFRVMLITLPIIINDLWAEVA